MRISDWSSDVCSSDLLTSNADPALRGTCQFPPPDLVRTMMDPEKIAHWQAADAAFDQWLDLPQTERDAWLATQPLPEPVRRRLVQLITAHERPRASRSEEHTSELQSLMPNSYAVFCWKKKNTTTH